MAPKESHIAKQDDSTEDLPLSHLLEHIDDNLDTNAARRNDSPSQSTRLRRRQNKDKGNHIMHNQLNSSSPRRRHHHNGRNADDNTLYDYAALPPHRRRRRKKGVSRMRTMLDFHPTIVLPAFVLLDMTAVSFVVPLLFQYFAAAGMKSAAQRELLSSVFSAAQICGGLGMGVLTDAKIVSRRTILLVSFGGSAVSYALVVVGGLPALVLSRLLVGLVKQTMTITTTMLTNCTSKTDRAKYMGRLTAASTIAWIVGPSTGALLYRYVDHRAPAVVACGMFVLNLVLAFILIDANYEERHHDVAAHGDENANDGKNDSGHAAENGNARQKNDGARASDEEGKPTNRSLWRNIQSCFSSRALAAVVLTQLVVTFVTKATNYSQLGSFYEDMYGLQPHHRGYISSYQQLLQFAVQATLVQPILYWSGGERRTICVFTALLAAAVFFEARRSLALFLIVLCPLISLGFAMTNLSTQTLITHVAPPGSTFSVLAALDVLQNAVSVSVPFYRTLLFRFLSPSQEGSVTMKGDPDPVAWVLASGVHWTLAAGAVTVLLLSNEQIFQDKTKKKGK